MKILFFVVFLVYCVVNGILYEKEYDLYIGSIITFSLITLLCVFEYAFHYNKEDEGLVKLVIFD